MLFWIVQCFDCTLCTVVKYFALCCLLFFDNCRFSSAESLSFQIIWRLHFVFFNCVYFPSMYFARVDPGHLGAHSTSDLLNSYSVFCILYFVFCILHVLTQVTWGPTPLLMSSQIGWRRNPESRAVISLFASFCYPAWYYGVMVWQEQE